MTEYKKYIVIPDQHISRNTIEDRFVAMGNFIECIQPEVVVNLGDVYEFESLYGVKNPSIKTKIELERYLEETSFGRQAMSRLFNPQKISKNKKLKRKRPKTVLTLGNHDIRFHNLFRKNESAFRQENSLWGVDDWLGFKGVWDEIHPYQQPVEMDGITFCHNFVSGTAVASNVDKIVQLVYGSAVGGHSHKAQFEALKSSTGRPVFGLQTGWFMDHREIKPDWVGSQGDSNWWSGFAVLHGVSGDGSFDPEFVSTERLLRDYL